jgi:hypothetical protein
VSKSQKTIVEKVAKEKPKVIIAVGLVWEECPTLRDPVHC